MFYVHPVFRPPSEGDSLLLQVTVGCNHPTCKFCFCSLLPEDYVRGKDEVLADVDEAGAKYGSQVEKVFFLLASALCAPTDTLLAAAGRCREVFPNLRQISSYGHPLDILRKSDEELRALAAAGLTRLYVGIESGSEEVLRHMKKGGTPRQIERAGLRAIEAGMTLSCQIILGLGGKRFTNEHAEGTARILSAVSPDYVGFLSLMVTPRTELAREVEEGAFELLDDDQYLDELERIIEGTEARRPIVVRTNHPSNYVTVRGTLPSDKAAILETIRSARAGAVSGNEEYLRNL